MTGSGKSEFLRYLALSLAASYDPSRLKLSLIDFKGGAAFDVCSGPPHVIGMVTNLDQQLGCVDDRTDVAVWLPSPGVSTTR